MNIQVKTFEVDRSFTPTVKTYDVISISSEKNDWSMTKDRRRCLVITVKEHDDGSVTYGFNISNNGMMSGARLPSILIDNNNIIIEEFGGNKRFVD